MSGTFCPECHSAVESTAGACGACRTARPAAGWPDDDRTGQLLRGRYRLERRLAAGGFGTVFLATHVQGDVELGRVVVKFLHRELAASAKTRRRVLNEVRVARVLVNPHIVRVLDLDEDEHGIPFQVQEYVDGEGLDRLVRRAGRLPPDRAAEIARQVAEGLAEAHAKDIVHRDLKPENVRIERSTGLVKLLDFGVARVIGPHGTATTSLIGTPRYMAPEQILGRHVDGRTDIWALGVLLFEMLTGEPPIPAEGTEMAYLSLNVGRTPRRVREVSSDCPEALDELVSRMLAKEPERRPRDMASVAEALRAVADAADAPSAVVASAAGAPGSLGSDATLPARTVGDASVATGDRTRPAAAVDEDTLPTFGMRRRRRLAVGLSVAAAAAVVATVLLWPAAGHDDRREAGAGPGAASPGEALRPTPPPRHGEADVPRLPTVQAPPVVPTPGIGAASPPVAPLPVTDAAAFPPTGPVPPDAGPLDAARRDGRRAGANAVPRPEAGLSDAGPARSVEDAAAREPPAPPPDAGRATEQPFEKIGTARRVQGD